MKVVLLAGGKGTRARPFSDYIPKSMIPIEGRPVIDQVVRYLARFAIVEEILIETDGPVQYPRCFAKLPALPTSFLVTVAKSVGEVLDISYLEVTEFITSNTENFLGKKLW